MLCRCAIKPSYQPYPTSLEKKKESEEPSVALCGPISLALPVLEKQWSMRRKKKEGIDTSWPDLPGHTVMYRHMRCPQHPEAFEHNTTQA